VSKAKSRVKYKHLRLDSARIARAKKLLRAETETIERALDLVLAEHDRNQLAWSANRRFLKSGAVIRDVYGKFSDNV